MAVTWGPARLDGSNGMRLGYEFFQFPSTVTNSTTSVTIVLHIWVWTRRSVVDSTNSFSVGGGWWSHSGSVSINHGSSTEWSTSNRTRIFNEQITLPPQFSGPVNRSFSASLSGINAVSGTASTAGTHTVQQRPPLAPAAPSSVSTARNSDTRHVTSWTRNETAGAPYDNIIVSRWDSDSGEYKVIATLGGTATSYTDNSTVANRRYRYQIAARNSAGTSADATGNYISTTPADPTSVTASKTSSNDIELSWNASHIHAVTGYHIDRRENGEAWTFVTSIGHPVTSWTHVSPSTTVTHQYRVRSVAALDSPTLNSEWVESNTIQLAAPPNAPALVAPTTVRDPTDPIVFSWTHNPVDTSAQTQYGFRYRVDGGAWNEVTVTSSAQSRTLAGGTFSGGSVVEWQVRTRGEHAVFGPWSGITAFPTSEKPVASPTPVPGGILGTSRFTGEWGYFDPENTDQSGWQVRLEPTAGGLLSAASGSGTTSTWAFNDILPDGGAFTFKVRVQDGDGLWSDWASTSFTVEYPFPPTPTVTGEFVVDEGAMTLSIENPIPGVGEEETAFNNVYRMVDGQWVQLETGLDPNSAFTDYVPYLGGVENLYAVEAVSVIGTSAMSDILILTENSTNCDEWVWLNAGPGWSVRARVRGDVDVGVARSRQKTLRRFVGRSKPLEYASEWVEHTVNLSGSLQSLPLNDEESWLAIADQFAPVMFRDMFGRRLYVSVEDVALGQEIHDYQSLSVSMTEVDAAGTEGEHAALVEYRSSYVVMWRRDYHTALTMNDPALVTELSTYDGWLAWYTDTGGFDG